jgi:predicted Rossmann fold nucleotide-binding protein DprA/Smf involved in DNA uptake
MSPTLALLCSTRAPAGVLLAVHDLAQQWRRGETVIVSGFHSPVEREAFTVLLRGPGRLVWVPARGAPARLPPDARAALAAGRLTIETPFDDRIRRATRATAAARNRYVCGRADAVLIAYAHPGGDTAALAQELLAAGRLVYALDHPANAPLLAVGATCYTEIRD